MVHYGLLDQAGGLNAQIMMMVRYALLDQAEVDKGPFQTLT